MKINKIQSLHLRLTNKCPVGCKHCYAFSENSNNSFLPIEIIDRTLKELSKTKNIKITLTGGEPSIHPLFFNIVSKISDFIMTNNDGCIQIESSGVSKNILKIVNILRHVKHNITISYDFPPIRNEHVSLKAEKIINFLKEKDLNISLQTVVIPSLLSKMDEILKFSEKLNVPHRLFPGTNNLGRSKSFKRLTYSDIIKVGLNLPAKAYWELPLFINPTSSLNTTCGWNSYRCEILSDCSVTYCAAISYSYNSEILGNLKLNSLADIWENSARLNFIRNIEQNCFGEPCKSCEYFFRCYGSCRASALGWCKEFLAPYPICYDKYLLKSKGMTYNE